MQGIVLSKYIIDILTLIMLDRENPIIPINRYFNDKITLTHTENMSQEGNKDVPS